MRITHLDLNNFRNYQKLSFDIPENISVYWGANAQGKTNLLESICFLATTRFSRSVPDKEIINWNALREKIPFGNVRGNIRRSDRKTDLEIILRPRSLAETETGNVATIHKHVKINGIGLRAVDLMGHLNMVMFSPRDIDLITDEPALRRRHLDITISQIDSEYLRSLQRYNKVVSQRNHLLRQISMGYSRPDELVFWDEELVKSGSYILEQRQDTISRINGLVERIHKRLSADEESLCLNYVSSVGAHSDSVAGRNIEDSFMQAIKSIYEKELIRGQSMIGPHRDDVHFYVNGVNIGHYGSRGQQRTVALSLKLAESEFMLTRTGETPVLLLDDVLSELDHSRREHLLETVSQYHQVLITTTDLDRFPSEFLQRIEKFEVKHGEIV